MKEDMVSIKSSVTVKKQFKINAYLLWYIRFSIIGCLPLIPPPKKNLRHLTSFSVMVFHIVFYRMIMWFIKISPIGNIYLLRATSHLTSFIRPSWYETSNRSPNVVRLFLSVRQSPYISLMVISRFKRNSWMWMERLAWHESAWNMLIINLVTVFHR